MGHSEYTSSSIEEKEHTKFRRASDNTIDTSKTFTV